MESNISKQMYNKDQLYFYKDIIIDKKYNFKKTMLSKLQLDENFEVKKIEDIAIIQSKFSLEIPYNNVDLVNGIDQIGIDYIVKRLVIDGEGGICTTLNILIGCLLMEFGIDVQLIKCFTESPHNIIPHFNVHVTNVITFHDGKQYLVDVGAGFFGSFNPIELGNEQGVLSNSGNNNYYRVISSESGDGGDSDGSFIYQERKSDGTDYHSFFQFNCNHITLDEIFENHTRYLEIVDWKLFSFINHEKGYYYINNDCLKIGYYCGKEKFVTITDNSLLKEVLYNYFKINLNNNTYTNNTNKEK